MHDAELGAENGHCIEGVKLQSQAKQRRRGVLRGENGFWSLYDVSQVSRTGETNRQSGVAEVGRLGDGYKSAARQCSPERAGGRAPLTLPKKAIRKGYRPRLG